MQKTQNYNLNQWEPTDPIRRADFNSDNAKLDAALAANAKALSDYQTANDAAVAKKAEQSAVTALQQSMNTEFAAVAANLGSGGKNARIAWGSYTGTGTYGKNNPTSLTFGFYPYLVLISQSEYANSLYCPSVLIRGIDLAHSVETNNNMMVMWSDNGVSWIANSDAEQQNNLESLTYYYVAIGYDAAT